jgi:hypothetical protein
LGGGGGGKGVLRRAAERRKKLVGQNPDEGFVSLLDRVRKDPKGRKALARYKKFWGLSHPTEIKTLEIPGPRNKTVFLVGMGRSPQVNLANGNSKGAVRKRVRGKFLAATDAEGKRIFMLSGRSSKDSKARTKFVGYAPETHYIPTDKMENAGTFKKGRYWVHKHDDDGGAWPVVKKDQAGNFVYEPGTYRVKDWIYR